MKTTQQQKRLLLLDEVQTWQKDNEYIRTSYRYASTCSPPQMIPSADSFEHARFRIIVSLGRQPRSYA